MKVFFAVFLIIQLCIVWLLFRILKQLGGIDKNASPTHACLKQIWNTIKKIATHPRTKTIITFLFYIVIVVSIMAIKGALSDKRHTRSINRYKAAQNIPAVKQDIPALKIEDLPSYRRDAKLLEDLRKIDPQRAADVERLRKETGYTAEYINDNLDYFKRGGK